MTLADATAHLRPSLYNDGRSITQINDDYTVEWHFPQTYIATEGQVPLETLDALVVYCRAHLTQEDR